ncbi:MAG: TonB-dependent receptor plug domain-containing protein, partial [Aliihoeflea sp.]
MRGNLSVRNAVAVLTMCVSPLAVTSAYAQTATELEAIEVVGEDDSPRGPDIGIVATRSQAPSKTDTPLIETPQAVSVVTRDQMDAQGANAVSEALRYTPGVLSDPNGFDTRYDWLFVRGFNAYGVAWLDGLILPGDPSGYAVPRINSYALERVEVIKGPASVLYGRSVPGGLVNLVSKRPQTETYREAEIQTNAFGGIQGAVDMTGSLTDDGVWSYRLTGLAKNLHTQIDSERDRQFMIAPSLTWSPSVDTSLTVYGYFQR